MDITLLRTFIEVAQTGSFGTAADRLFVTQSAVSLRIAKLEETLGRALFTRSKAGAELTQAGSAFEHYALSLLRTWEDACHQMILPDGFKHTLNIGAQYSLWPRMGFRWVDRLQTRVPELSIRTELGMSDRLTRFLIEGHLHCALMYTPQLRPGLDVQKVMDEELILVSSWPAEITEIDKGRYVYVDWGPEFAHFHAQNLSHLKNTGLTMSLGAMVTDYVIHRKAAAYLPARFVKDNIDAGELHPVPNAPHFAYPIWSVWRDDTDPIIRAAGQSCLDEISQRIIAHQEKLIESID
ncbi:MAG: LysR family transcriptional regulator [Rhodobacteraceae bacterium]|jgi:DNA-binding transcriptional LysR family regulator|nr:LysR family transcriptional regulator [Paracoccaceae bacterium]